MELKMHRPRSVWREDDGIALIEFILIMPMLLVIVVAAWEFGRILDAQMILTNGAREGARFAAASYPVNQAATQNRVMAYLADGYGVRLDCSTGDICLNASDVQVEFFDDGGNPTGGAPGARVRVTVPAQTRILTDLVPGLSDPFAISGRASMRIQ